jgi:hypothetical protein
MYNSSSSEPNYLLDLCWITPKQVLLEASGLRCSETLEISAPKQIFSHNPPEGRILDNL